MCSWPGRSRPGRTQSITPRVMRGLRSGEGEHAADPVLALHQLKALVDLVKRQAVGDEGIDVEPAVEIELHELGHLVAALDPAETTSRRSAGR
jgi:hypothetical protein